MRCWNGGRKSSGKEQDMTDEQYKALTAKSVQLWDTLYDSCYRKYGWQYNRVEYALTDLENSIDDGRLRDALADIKLVERLLDCPFY
jgi:hypothetical protein